ncbi:hypothetical protein MMC17_008192 [Xylographa soralifera]|nr:hypothetical protein [Xylographa soralifera]
MSGLEGIGVVGAIASVAQLSQYMMGTSCSIFELYGTLRNAPKKFQRYACTMKQIIEIAQLIQANEWLQSSSAVAKILRDTIQRAEQVQDLLPRVPLNGSSGPKNMLKYWRLFTNLRKESQVIEILANLEENKSALTLYILDIQTKHSGQACYNTKKLLDMLPKSDSIQYDAFQAATPVDPIERPNPDIESQSSCDDIPIEEPSLNSPASSEDYSSERSEDDSVLTGVNSHSAKVALHTDTLNESPQYGSVYDGAIANGKSCQINGDIGAGLFPLEKHRYYKIIATDSSLQINGNVTSDALSFLSIRR